MMSVVFAMLLVLILVITGVPILYSFTSGTLLLIVALGLDPSFLMSYGYDAVSSVVLLCVPLYVCVGSIMTDGGIGKTLVEFVDVFVGRIKGGLGVVCVVACAVFGSISGSSTATLTCIGSIVIPRMIEKKYPKGIAAALVTNACPLGLLIPPSSTMIIFAWASRQSILACFLATVIPGLILAAMLSITTIFMLRNNKEVEVEDPITSREFLSRVKTSGISAIPALLMPVIILGGTYSGFFTPTESAAVAVIYAIPVGFFIYRKLTAGKLFKTFVDTACTAGVVMVMVFCMMILSRILIMMDIPHARFTQGTQLNMKLEPAMMAGDEGIANMMNLLKSLCTLDVYHAQFNVVDEKTLRAAQEKPEDYKHLLVRVAGYTAFFVELGKEVQDEIIARTVIDNWAA